MDGVSRNIELSKSNITKLITFKNILFKVFGAKCIKDIDEEYCEYFGKTIERKWLKNNIENIKKLFRLRGKAYNNLGLGKDDFYSVYRMMITIAKSLFGNDIFVDKRIKKKQVNYIYNIIDLEILEKHKELFDKKTNEPDFIDLF